MFKNVASQKIALLAIDSATGRPKTGDAANLTAYVSKDNGTVTALGDTSATQMDATNAPGWYLFDLTQAETNADVLLFTGKSSTSGVDIVGEKVLPRPPNFPALSIDTGGAVAIKQKLRKNQALANFHFMMTDSTTHNPSTGKTVTATRVLDNGSFAACANSVVEVASGVYRIDLAAADLNANVASLRFTASGCDDTVISLTLDD